MFFSVGHSEGASVGLKPDLQGSASGLPNRIEDVSPQVGIHSDALSVGLKSDLPGKRSLTALAGIPKLRPLPNRSGS